MPALNKNRAGHYVRQVTGYNAFMPAPLPPDPAVHVTGKLQVCLSNADRALGRLDGSIQTLPNPELFMFMYVRKEAVLSSQIEGTQSSIQDVLSAEAQLFSPGQPADVKEVINYVLAMDLGLQQLQSLPVSMRLLKQIHAALLKDVRGAHLTPGEFRRSQNWIGLAGCTLSEATFVPPPSDVVPDVLGQLERFIHETHDVPLLVKIGLVHAQFETIHPFLDGNGRIGRLLVTFLLCENKVLLKPVLYLSHYFKKHRSQYYQRLQAVRDQGDWEGWLIFFLTGVFEVSQQATETARRILLLREQHRDSITQHFSRSSASGQRVLEHLFTNPVVSVKDVQQVIEMSYPAANDLVARFVKLGILFERTEQARNRSFEYRPYIEIFNEDV